MGHLELRVFRTRGCTGAGLPGFLKSSHVMDSFDIIPLIIWRARGRPMFVQLTILRFGALGDVLPKERRLSLPLKYADSRQPGGEFGTIGLKAPKTR